MIGKSEIKIPGGKLIRVECTIDKKILFNVIITGDFFLHPEDGLQELEKALIGLRTEPEILTSHVLSFFRQGYTLVGAAPEDLAKAIVEAASQPSQSK